jgi:hypothetical protein
MVEKVGSGSPIKCLDLVTALTSDVMLDELAWIEIARHQYVPTPETLLYLKEVWRERMQDLTAVLTLGKYKDGLGGSS